MLNLRDKDKQQHLLAGIIVAGLLYPFLGHSSLVVTIIIGLFKEFIIDEIRSEGVPDI